MKHTFKFLGLGGGIAVISMFSACSSGTGTPASSTGGATSAGETGGAGGSASTDTGGHTGTGTGGSTSNGTGGGTSCPITKLFTFDTTAEGFQLDSTVTSGVDKSGDSAQGLGLNYINLAAPGDGGVIAIAPVLGWSGQVDYDLGATNKGALAITAQYNNWNQSVTAQVSAPVDGGGNIVDLTNKIITFNVMITGDGLTLPGNAGGGSVFLKTGGSYIWGQGSWTSISGTGSWITLSIDTAHPASTDPNWNASAPKQLGIQISSSGGGGTAASPTLYGTARNVTIYIDNITVTCSS